MTNDPGMRDRSVVRSSVSPSAKYSWSASRAVFAKGSTTMDSRGGLDGIGGSAAGVSRILGVLANFAVGGPRYGQAIHKAAAHIAPAALATAYQRQRLFGMIEAEGSLGNPGILSGRNE